MKNRLGWLLLCILVASFAASCGSGGGGDGGGGALIIPQTYTISGTVSGLTGTLVLQNNGADNLAIASNGTFTFGTKAADGAGYSVTIKTQPIAPAQTCTVSNNSGTIASAVVTNVSITCSAPAAVARTGLTMCDDSLGNIVSCATTTGNGQDGALGIGAAWPSQRFTFVSNGTGTVVTDNLTGLMWQGDGSTPDAGGLCTGGTMTWQAALNYAACLNAHTYLGYKDWRLPNANELQSLVNYGIASSLAAWLDTQGFTSTRASSYWSSTTYGALPTYARYLSFQDGNTYSSTKTSTYYVRCVRGLSGEFAHSVVSIPVSGQTTSYAPGDDGDLQQGIAWPSQRFAAISKGTGTVVTDSLTGLMWQGDGSTPDAGGLCTGGTTTWQGALQYAACLNAHNYLGYNDWRVPNVNELLSITNYGAPSGSNTWLDTQGFTSTRVSSYWSSSVYVPGGYGAWAVSLGNDATLGLSQTNPLDVRCVRGGQ